MVVAKGWGRRKRGDGQRGQCSVARRLSSGDLMPRNSVIVVSSTVLCTWNVFRG